MKNSILLTFASIVLLLWFLFLPGNHQWFNERIIGYGKDFAFQKNKLDIEYRKAKRWGSDYTVSKTIAALLPKTHDKKHALIMVPPSDYFKERNIDYHVPEPAVFYYYTGVKTTWINSREALKANWMVSADKGILKLVPISNEKVLLDSITALRKYPVTL